ncbi:MAG TPA: spermidine/putrescine ABC transporter [Elusimicrobia bacterium]|nr:spermidine/putrescine ABC transporter [Elusimicrobiota bacterium]HBT61709.1 spermidine/putrescine ABC transporter [Elusimicrobiota bacterium]
MSGGALLELVGISKSFGANQVLADVHFTVGHGEFLTLLGPSGCGKTTSLRIIAGFEEPDQGRVLLRGDDVTILPPYRRDVHTVFQHYALFPHYNVFDNVAFGLRLRRLPPDEIRGRVTEALSLVRLSGFESRRTTELSGGQMQRIALARALVGRPALLLLDEPLGALDLKLRRGMQLELKAIQRRLKIAFVYVTHDQDEAMAMSDRIVVFQHGRVEQIGTPEEIYRRPKTSFVADFMGSANILSGRLTQVREGCVRVRLEDEVDVEFPYAEPLPVAEGEELCVAIRPERISVRYESELALVGDCVQIPARLTDTVYLGDETQLFISPFPKSGKTLLAASMDVRHQAERQKDAPIWADIRWQDILLLEPPGRA